MRKTIVTMLLVLACCHRAAPTVSPGQAGHRDALVELAARIDPNEFYPPLDHGTPPWLADVLLVADRPDVAAIAKRLAAEPSWRLPAWGTGNTPAVLELLRAAASLERALERLEGRARLDAQFVLVEVYSRLDAPMLDEGKSEIALQFRTLLVADLTGVLADRFAEVWPVIQATVSSAGQLQRHLLAELMRTAEPTDPRLTLAMLVAAEHLLAGPPSRDDLALVRTAIDVRGDDIEHDRLLDAAVVCMRGLDDDCAGDMLARVPRQTAKGHARTQARLHDAELLLAKVRRLHALDGASGLEADVERTRLLEELGRMDDAHGAYGALVKRHPRDARVVIGFERMRFMRDFDFVAAEQRLDQIAQPLEHVEAEYYEYAIGVRAAAASLGAAALGETATEEEADAAIDALVPKLAGDATKLARLGSDAGVVLEYVFDVGMAERRRVKRGQEDEWAFSDRVLVDMLKLRERFPESMHVHRLLIASAVLATNRALADRALALPVPKEGGATLVLEHVRAQHAAAIVWSQPPPIPDEDATWSPDAVRELAGLRADAEAIAARSSSSSAWIDVAKRYTAPVEAGEQIDLRHANSLAAAFAQSGNTSEAVKVFQEVVNMARQVPELVEGDVPLLNLVALGGGPRSQLELLASSEDPTVQALALALLVGDSKGAERKRWRARLARVEDLRCQDVARGFAMSRSFGFQLGYSSTTGLRIELELEVEPWLLVDAATAPLLEQVCTGAAAAGRRSGPGA